jgi:hypothetical protein|tara:strand:- start:425 stop:766 length:342 start_codon:yes stop_codon:yes gene_type:complete
MTEQTDKNLELKMNMEKFTLLPGRYYVILEPLGLDEFSITAYDTMGKDAERGKYAAEIIQEGILALVRDQLDFVYDTGKLEIESKKSLNKFTEDVNLPSPKDNIVKVDFGKKQ